MSSLYDKYHSDHNRNYMYSLIKNIIFKEHKLDVSLNETYNHFFQTNFINFVYANPVSIEHCFEGDMRVG